MTTSQDKVLQYLEEVHALEAALVSTLGAHIAMTPRGPYRSLLEKHQGETRDQVARIEQRLRELGQGGSLVHLAYGTAQTVVGQITALAMAPLSLLRGTGGEEKLLKNAKDEAASEALEIATYDALVAVAEAVSDDKTAVLAREHRFQEEQFLDELRALIPELAEAVIEAEVEGHARYDVRTTGAADAVRKASGAAKATARGAVAKVEEAVEEAGDEVRHASGRVEDSVEAAGEEVLETIGAGDDDLPIAGYDELTPDQIVAKLKALSPEELAAVDGYERGGKGRKRVLDRISSLRTRRVEEQLAQV